MRQRRTVPRAPSGEKPALLLPDTPKTVALTFSRAIAKAFEVTALPHPDSQVAPHVTVSGGIRMARGRSLRVSEQELDRGKANGCYGCHRSLTG